ncbi:DUF2975 domain-containing protein [Gleimia europaea]|uniref:DUF2975 domain-containing protein n=1 Tax=Gleimia europaea ACS-120-V-Col10b TaxID=883069 RepID=A0A9W5VWK6_9ACTO|nr:DUF2975 domain-containing protein [Gleimia europaea]EPD30979.1 hypothetical protein HMPREF9238_00735 [Gleimia europaea ACS-120-V-Col10b]
MSRLEKVPFWFAAALVWVFSLLMIAGQTVTVVELLSGKRVFGGTPISACDLPNFCLQGESEVPLSYVSAASIQLAIAEAALIAVVIAAGLIIGTAVIREISRGRAFERQTVRLMGVTGIVLALGGVICGFVSDAARSCLQEDSIAFQEAVHPGSGSIVVGEKPVLAAALFFAGVIALALWAAFRQGARMREELDYVI